MRAAMIAEAATVAALLYLARRLRRAGRDMAAASAGLAEAARAYQAQAEAIERARAEVADLQAQAAGLRAILRDLDRGDDRGPGEDDPPPGSPDPLAGFLARRAQAREGAA